MASSLYASIPLLIVFVFLQRYLVSGLTAGAVKG
jgi:ABC-type glycerol-3-phosphate transport system permease component